jgi:hypothetical protein
MAAAVDDDDDASDEANDDDDFFFTWNVQTEQEQSHGGRCSRGRRR